MIRSLVERIRIKCQRIQERTKYVTVWVTLKGTLGQDFGGGNLSGKWSQEQARREEQEREGGKGNTVLLLPWGSIPWGSFEEPRRTCLSLCFWRTGGWDTHLAALTVWELPSECFHCACTWVEWATAASEKAQRQKSRARCEFRCSTDSMQGRFQHNRNENQRWDKGM